MHHTPVKKTSIVHKSSVSNLLLFKLLLQFIPEYNCEIIKISPPLLSQQVRMYYRSGTVGHCCIGVGQTLRVHSSDGGTFAWNDVMAAILKLWWNRLHQSMRIYLKNYPAILIFRHLSEEPHPNKKNKKKKTTWVAIWDQFLILK